MRVPTIAATLLALSAGSPVIAMPSLALDPPVATQHVSYGDLDLTRAADVHLLLHRAHSAARFVCDDNAGRDLLRRASEQSCFDVAMNGAADQIERAVANAVGQETDTKALASLDR